MNYQGCSAIDLTGATPCLAIGYHIHRRLNGVKPYFIALSIEFHKASLSFVLFMCGLLLRVGLFNTL